MDALAQRLSNLTQILVVLMLISFVGALRRWDASSVRDDAIALGTLTDPANNLDPTRVTDDAKVYARLLKWIASKDAAAEKKRLAVQADFVKWLQKSLAEGAFDAPRFEGKGPSHGPAPEFYLEEFTLSGWPPADNAKPSTVAGLLDRLESWSQPLSIALVSSWEQDPRAFAHVPAGATVSSIELTGDHIVISFDPSTRNAQQGEIAPVTIAAHTVGLNTTERPTLFDLAPLAAEAQGTLTDLGSAARTEQRTRLRNKYGAIPSSSALPIVQDELSAAYKSIDIFGFSVSPAHLPLALLAGNLVIAGLLWMTVRGAIKRKVTLGKDVASALFPLIEHRPMRLLAWVIAPLVGVWVTAMFDVPGLRAGGGVLIGLCAGTSGVLGLTLASFWSAQKLMPAPVAPDAPAAAVPSLPPVLPTRTQPMAIPPAPAATSPAAAPSPSAAHPPAAKEPTLAPLPTATGPAADVSPSPTPGPGETPPTAPA